MREVEAADSIIEANEQSCFFRCYPSVGGRDKKKKRRGRRKRELKCAMFFAVGSKERERVKECQIM